MPPHPLANFEIQKYYESEPKLNGVSSRNNLPEIKDAAYVINRDEYKTTGMHWIALYIISENATYFNSFGVDHILKVIRNFKESKNVITIIYRIQAYNLIMCGYFCIGFIDVMLKDESLSDYTNLLFRNKYKIK